MIRFERVTEARVVPPPKVPAPVPQNILSPELARLCDGHSTLWKREDLCIYLVVLRDHPEKVKVGKTHLWERRRKVYADWNLAEGDAIQSECVFDLLNTSILISKAETLLLNQAPFPLAYRREWFSTDIGSFRAFVERTFNRVGIPYAIRGGDLEGEVKCAA